jgi:hypothetical protein
VARRGGRLIEVAVSGVRRAANVCACSSQQVKIYACTVRNARRTSRAEKAEHGRGAAMARRVAQAYGALVQGRRGDAHRKLAGEVLRRSRARGARVGDPVCDLDGGVVVAASGEAAWLGATARKKRWTSSRYRLPIPRTGAPPRALPLLLHSPARLR